MPPPTPRHGQICGKADRLRDFADEHDLGHVLCNDSGVITERDPDTVRGADVSFYSYAKVPRGRSAGLPGRRARPGRRGPLGGRSLGDILTKVEEYLQPGSGRDRARSRAGEPMSFARPAASRAGPGRRADGPRPPGRFPRGGAAVLRVASHCGSLARDPGRCGRPDGRACRPVGERDVRRPDIAGAGLWDRIDIAMAGRGRPTPGTGVEGRVGPPGRRRPAAVPPGAAVGDGLPPGGAGRRPAGLLALNAWDLTPPGPALGPAGPGRARRPGARPGARRRPRSGRSRRRRRTARWPSSRRSTPGSRRASSGSAATATRWPASCPATWPAGSPSCWSTSTPGSGAGRGSA